jgi:hypothetical protein|tara:strand:- start:572 stop:721 length:150 start_codon:yes stop_codon:yes gene_type:complete
MLENFYAYIDAGTGSAILTLLIGAIVGIGVTLRMYWEKLKYKFTKKEKN